MTDLNSLKTELGKLTDLDYLKSELNRIAAEIKRFDMHVSLSPQAKVKLDRLEKRFRGLLKTITALQKQVDKEVSRFIKIAKKTSVDAEKKIRKSVGLANAKPVKKAAKAAKTTTKKKATARKSSKKTATK
jgi:hypothetical protein